LLNQGEIAAVGDSSSIVDQYLQQQNTSENVLERCFEENEEKEFQVLKASLRDVQGQMTREFDCDNPVIIRLECVVHNKIPGLYGYLSIGTLQGETVMVSDSNDHTIEALGDLSLGNHTVEIKVPARSLAPGEYTVYLNFTSNSGMRGFNIDSPGQLFRFNLTDFSTRRGNSRRGYFSTCLEWNIQ
jgi:hypothetical protein